MSCARSNILGSDRLFERRVGSGSPCRTVSGLAADLGCVAGMPTGTPSSARCAACRDSIVSLLSSCWPRATGRPGGKGGLAREWVARKDSEAVWPVVPSFLRRPCGGWRLLVAAWDARRGGATATTLIGTRQSRAPHVPVSYSFFCVLNRFSFASSPPRMHSEVLGCVGFVLLSSRSTRRAYES